MILTARVMGEKDGKLWLAVPMPENYQGEREALVELQDGRTISPAQRRKAYVLINAIAAWAGYVPADAEKEILKCMFLASGETLNDTGFSLASCSMTEARLFITWLVTFCLLYDVPIGNDPLNELVEDIPHYVYYCLIAKKCAVCGRKAELHHVDAVGMGRNRKEICHIGMRALPLCRKHHMEIHSCGSQKEFIKRYMLEPVKIDRRIAKVYKLKARAKNEG